MSAEYEYENDLLTKILTPTTTYNFTYGNFGLRSEVKIGENRTLATYTYTEQNNYLSSIDYGNGGRVEYKYDQKGRLIKQIYDGGDTVTYTYDNSGALAKVYDSATGITTTNYYDFTDRLMKYVESGSGFNHSVGYEYDDKNNLTKLVETINGTAHTTEYAYDDDNRVTSVTADGTTVTYSYDAFGRVTQQVTKNGSTQVLKDSFSFVNPTASTTSAQIATHTIDAAGPDKTFTYEYDDNGNITRISDGTNTITYTYDTANQLIREDNFAGGYSYAWEYDAAGNIKSRKEYAYTQGSLTNVSPEKTITYGYGDSKWKDLLTAYDGRTISYDTIGNPLSDGIWSYEWEHGRELAEISAEGLENGAEDVTVQYVYNANGIRTKKTVTTLNYATHTHSYTSTVVTPTCTENGYTEHVCACGDSYRDAETAARGHFFPTATSACTRCGASNHNHAYTVSVVAATCTEGGYTLYTCTCGASVKENVTAARGHFFPSEAATVCTRCGYDRSAEAGAASEEQPTLLSTEVQEYIYVYDGDSLTQMTVQTTTTPVDGSSTTTTDTLNFTYDAASAPLTVTYNQTTYYFVTNVQGDVTALVNNTGATVAEYAYDAWGNLLTDQATATNPIADLNPLRYRGYVYDTETKLYYLQSRYYNPEVGRFINADNYPTTGQGITGNNMFAYCGNNPVSREDDGGEIWNVVIGAVVGGAISLVSATVSVVCENAIEGKKFSLTDLGKIGVSTLCGIAEGILMATFPAASMAISSAVSIVETAVTGAIDGESFGEIVTNSLISGAIGAVAGSGGSEFVKGGKLINEAAGSVGNAIRKGVHPVVKKSAKKAIKKAAKKIGREYVFGQIEDFAYGGIYEYSSQYASLVVF